MAAFAVAVLALGAINSILVALLVWRRVRIAQRARRRARLEKRLRPLALDFVSGEGELPTDLDAREQRVLADVLGGYGRLLRGQASARIAVYFLVSGTVVRELGELKHGRRAWRRAGAAYRLGDMGSPAATAGLIEALGDADREVRTAATRSLGKLRAADAVGPLLAAAAARTVPPALAGWSLLQIGPPALPALRAALGNSEPTNRASAVRMLGLLGDPGDAVAVEAGLRDTSALVRAAAARSLQRLGSARSVPLLLLALDDRFPAVRAAAAEALGRLSTDEVEPLLRRAQDDWFDVSRAAARAAAHVDLSATTVTAERSGASHLAEAVDLARLG